MTETYIHTDRQADRARIRSILQSAFCVASSSIIAMQNQPNQKEPPLPLPPKKETYHGRYMPLSPHVSRFLPYQIFILFPVITSTPWLRSPVCTDTLQDNACTAEFEVPLLAPAVRCWEGAELRRVDNEGRPFLLLIPVAHSHSFASFTVRRPPLRVRMYCSSSRQVQEIPG